MSASDPIPQSAPDPEEALAGLCLALLRPQDRAALSDAERALLPAASVPSAADIAAAREAIEGGADVLGDLFCQTRSATSRRDLGQFYTPPFIVQAMAGWALSRGPQRIVDAGCGSGRYVVALRRMGFTGQLIAVDLDPLAALMTRAHLAAANLPAADVRCTSFLDLNLDPVEASTCFIGNPPYLRHHDLSAEVKRWAKDTASRIDVPISGLAGLHALFFLKVAASARAGDFGSFITSSEWFDNGYGQVVRNLLTHQLPLVRLDALTPEAALFDDAHTTAAIASFEVGGDRGRASVRQVRFREELDQLEGGDDIDLPTMSASKRWSDLGNPAPEVRGDRVRLGEFMRVRRGLATGANRFFCVPSATVEHLGLGQWAVPVVSRAHEILHAPSRGEVRAGDLGKVLLTLPHRDADPAVEAHVSAGEGNGDHLGYIARSRGVWYQLAAGAAPDALATVMARQAPVFAVNCDRVAHLNTVHGLHRRETFPAELVPVLVEWLNEHRDELTGGRTYAGGLRKVEPKEMEAFLVPTIDSLRLWAAERAAGVGARADQ